MRPSRLYRKSIRQLQIAQSQREVTARGLVAHYLVQIAMFDQSGPRLNAIAATNRQAMGDAEMLDHEREQGRVRGPMHGIPVLVKDNIETAAMPTTAGSGLLAGWTPGADAVVVRRLREAGAIILAKTNMHEFGYGIRGFGSSFGQVRNPYNLARYPGGSSSGSAAGLAAGFGAVALGTDTSGSIGIPCAYNGLVGLRGTQGLLSCKGVIPLSSTQDVVGPIAHSVEDAAVVLDALSDVGHRAPHSNPPAVGSYAGALGSRAIGQVRIGKLSSLFCTEPADREVAEIVAARLEQLRVAGASIVDVEIPGLADLLHDRLYGSLVLVQDFKFDLDAYLAKHPTAPLRSFQELIDSGRCHPLIQSNLQLSAATASRDTDEYAAHVAKRRALREALVSVLDRLKLDALVFPTMRQKAALIGEPQGGSNSQVSANSGLPALTLPSGFDDMGVPVGMDLIGRPWSEATLLAIGCAIEKCSSRAAPPALVERAPTAPEALHPTE